MIELIEEISERFYNSKHDERYLDLKKILFYIRSGIENQRDLLKGKKVVILLGLTGSGKSTTIHSIAGYKMIKKTIEKEKIDEKSGINLQFKSKVIESETKLDDFDIGHDYASTTR